MAAVTLTFSNLVSGTAGTYVSYANKIVAFTFLGFTGLTRINGELIGNIVTIPNNGNNPKLETVTTYGVGAEWAIPSNYLGKFTNGGNTFYVVFAYIDPAGTRSVISGTAAANVILEMDDTYLTSNFKLTGAKLVGLPSRTDCGVVATNFQIAGNASGEIPINATN